MGALTLFSLEIPDASRSLRVVAPLRILPASTGEVSTAGADGPVRAALCVPGDFLMAYIQLHDTLRQHPKLFVLCELLSWRRAEAIGHLAMLWCWALEHCEDGYLIDVPKPALASIMDLSHPGEIDHVLDAMKTAKFIDEDRRLHNWERYSARFIAERKRGKERREAYKATRDAERAALAAEKPRKNRGKTAAKTRLTGSGSGSGALTGSGSGGVNPEAAADGSVQTPPQAAKPSYREFVDAWVQEGFAAPSDGETGRDTAWWALCDDPFVVARWREAVARLARSEYWRKRATVGRFMRRGEIAAILDGERDDREQGPREDSAASAGFKLFEEAQRMMAKEREMGESSK